MSSDLYLAMGCFGRRDGDFISCRAVENNILKIDPDLEYYEEISKYLESLRLFDKPLFDINAIRHMFYNMQDRYDQKIKRLWTEQQFNLYEKFMLTHKMCGIYVKLTVSQAAPKSEPCADERVLIPAAKPIKTQKAELHKKLMLRGRQR